VSIRNVHVKLQQSFKGYSRVVPSKGNGYPLKPLEVQAGKSMRIGILGDRTGTTVATIRYYEEIGLLRRALRQTGGQRTYDNEDVRRLGFIRACRDFGFSIDEVRMLLSLTNDSGASCTGARDLAVRHLGAVQQKLGELRALEKSITALVSTCNSTCVGGAASDCSIFEDIRCEAPKSRMVQPD
jgi:DNA-binding transcriptional MerR regulator